jgi:hypothetical protein
MNRVRDSELSDTRCHFTKVIRWLWDVPFYGGRTMPEFTTVSVQEAQMRTIPGRQGTFINEYADYIQQVPQGQAGKLTIGEEEKHTTVRRRLVTAAKAMSTPLIIKRSGNDIYFWREEGGNEQPRRKRRYTRRAMGREETTAPDQPFSASEEVNHEAALEESPELGQTDQAVEDAMRRVNPE